MEVAGKVLETHQVRTDSKPLCELCAVEHVTRSATGACRECEEYICDSCFREHLKARACRGHVKITVDELPALKAKMKGKDVEKCQKHNELIKFYCRAHDVIGCADCVILEHTNCKPEYIRDITKSIRTDPKFTPLFTKMDEFEEIKSKGKTNMQRIAQEIDSLKKNALDEVRKFRTEINVYCDKAEAEIVSTVDRLTSENEQLKKNMEQEIKKLTTDIEEIQKSFSDPKQSEPLTFIQAVSHKSMIEAILPRFEKIRNTKDDLWKFRFDRNKEFSDIMKSTSFFGRIHELRTSDFTIGTRVRPGPDWNTRFSLTCGVDNEDGGGPGTVTGFSFSGWAEVKWDKGGTETYRIGQSSAFDLSIIQ